MALVDKTQSKYIQSVLAWGSVAYTLGFVTIIAHTARLGIPILQLLEPVYILIGAPLAVVAFFSRRMWIAFRKRTSNLKTKLEDTKEKISELRSKDVEINTPEEASTYLSQVLVDILSVPMTGFIGTAATPLMKLVIAHWLTQSNSVTEMFKSVTRKVRIAITIYKGILEVSRYIGFVILLSMIPVGIYLYVVYLYPTLPQSIGGGRPITAKLIVDLEKIPASAEELKPMFTTDPVSPVATTAITNALSILYSTEDSIYLRVNDGPAMALSRDVVNGILWNTEK